MGTTRIPHLIILQFHLLKTIHYYTKRKRVARQKKTGAREERVGIERRVLMHGKEKDRSREKGTTWVISNIIDYNSIVMRVPYLTLSTAL